MFQLIAGRDSPPNHNKEERGAEKKSEVVRGVNWSREEGEWWGAWGEGVKWSGGERRRAEQNSVATETSTVAHFLGDYMLYIYRFCPRITGSLKLKVINFAFYFSHDERSATSGGVIQLHGASADADKWRYWHEPNAKSEALKGKNREESKFRCPTRKYRVLPTFEENESFRGSPVWGSEYIVFRRISLTSCHFIKSSLILEIPPRAQTLPSRCE